MKTRKYKTIPVGSKCKNNQGIDPTYAHINKFGPPASIDVDIRDRIEMSILRMVNSESRKADRDRRKAEKHIDWDFIRELLDMGLSLAQAKLESQY